MSWVVYFRFIFSRITLSFSPARRSGSTWASSHWQSADPPPPLTATPNSKRWRAPLILCIQQHGNGNFWDDLAVYVWESGTTALRSFHWIGGFIICLEIDLMRYMRYMYLVYSTVGLVPRLNIDFHLYTEKQHIGSKRLFEGNYLTLLVLAPKCLLHKEFC